MRTHTTYTDLRRIMKLHEDGLNPDEISERIFVDVSAVKQCIDARTVKKIKRSKPALKTE